MRRGAAVATPAFVQKNSADPQAPQTSVTVQFTSAQAVGDLNVVIVGWNDSTASVSSVTDTKGNNYQLAVGPTVRPGSLSQSIYYARNIVAAAAKANTVTVGFSQAAAFPDIRILEYKNVDPTSPLDVTVAGNGSSATSDSGPVATTNAADLLVAGNMVETTTKKAGTGFTSRVISSPDSDIAEDRIVTALGSYSATATLSSSGQWVMQMVAFRAAGSVPDTQAPTAPANLTATSISNAQINLAWTAATDNTGVTAYLVDRCQGSGCTNFAQLGMATGTTFNNTSLSAATSYSYRVRATDAAGNLGAYSNTATATTASPDVQAPTAPANLTATATSNSQVNLTWTASTDDVGVTNYLIESCQGASCSTFAQIGMATSTTFSNTGLTAATSYSYRVRATDAAGNLSGYSNTASATTLTAPPTPPAFVQMNSADPQTSPTAVTIKYTAAQTAGDLNVVVVGWNDATSSVTAVTDTLNNAYQLAIGPTRQPGGWSQSIYYAKNVAAAAAGANTVSVAFSAGAAFPDVRILEYRGTDQINPLDVTIGAIGSGTSSATGAVTTTNASDLLVAANIVETTTKAAGAGFTKRTITSPDGDIVEDQIVTATGAYNATATLNASGRWIMQMVAFRAAGSTAPDTQAPTAPANLVATAVSSNQINLAWTAATDNVGVTNYLVESCWGSSCSTFSQIGTSTGTSFSSTGLTASSPYSFRVRATDAAGNLGTYSNTASATTLAPDLTPPTAPSALTAIAISGGQINLAWSGSTDDVGVTSYLVERCQGAACSSFAQIGTTPGTTYNNTGLSTVTSYSYRVRASDGAGNLSGYSNVASATTPNAPVTPGFVQGTFSTPRSPQSVVPVTFAGVQGSGDLNVVVVGWADTTSRVTSVADSKGNAYALAVGPTALGSVSQSIYYAKNIATAGAGTNTVTVTFNQAAAFPDIRVLEYTGIDTGNPFDAAATGTGSSLTSTTNPVVTSSPGELLVAANTVASVTLAAGSGFISRMITSPDGDIVEDRTVIAQGSYQASASLADVKAWVIQIAAFRAGGSAAPPPPDTTPPTVSVTSPAAGATLTGTVNVNVSASDSSGVATVQLMVDGTPVGIPVATPPYNFSLPTASFANGAHTVGAAAYDVFFNGGTAAPVAVTFSNTSSTPQSGLWSGTMPLPIVAVNAWLMPNGKVLMSDGQDIWGSDARVWDPATNTLVQSQSPSNIFCGGLGVMGDGKVFVAGGHNDAAHWGLTNTNIFDPATNGWTAAADMANPRWYPTVTTLPDGRMMITGGESNCNGCNVLVPEIYDPSTNVWTSLSAASFNFPYFPHVFVLPDGRIIVPSAGRAPIVSQVLDMNTQTWTAVGGAAVDGGSAAMYRPGKFLKTGTSVDPDLATRPSATTAYVLDATAASPAWRQAASMAFARTYHTMTSLPDGTVLVTGGGPTTAATDTGSAILPAEVWSPTTETFTRLAPMNAPRLYHSNAILLPDGRVAVSGGGRFDNINAPTDQFSAEIFSPPYLLQGARPVISSAPPTIMLGQQFTVQTPNASSIAQVSLIRFGAVTHTINMAQRFLPLAFTVGTGSLTVTAPANSNLAQPGYYMLFIVDTNGVPSIAATVRI